MTRKGRRTPEKPTTTPGRHEDPWVYEALGRAIKTARTERGIERKELAAATGLSYAYLSDIESGRRRPSSKAIFAIADALGMSPSQLMRWTEELTHRIASEESLDEGVSVRGQHVPARARRTEPTGTAPPAAPSATRASWFAEPLADVGAAPPEGAGQREGNESDPWMGGSPVSFRAALDRVLDRLSAEDLELVLDLAQRLAREHRPRG